MATKKPAVTTQLKTANARIAELEKELSSAKSNKDYYERDARKANEELNGLHALLDAMPGALPKEKKEGYGSHSAMTRLASWLASRQ